MGILDTLGNAAGQVGGFFKGAGEVVWETGAGIVDLGVGLAKTAYDTSPLGVAADAWEGATGDQLPDWAPSADRGNQRLESAWETASTIARNPGLLVDAIVDPIKEDWANGNYGEAIGRGVAEAVLTVVGTKGADKAAKGARAAGAADDVADAARAADHAADAGRVGHGLSQSQLDDVVAIEKGLRPDPSTYLPAQYIDDHLALFDDGATRFQLQSGLDKYGPGQRDGTSFVVPKAEADRLLAETAGDPRALEQALGLPVGQLDGADPLMRVDFDAPRDHGLRMPSGNEAGANDQWIPGGKLPNGNSEAIVDAGGLSPGNGYTATPVSP